MAQGTQRREATQDSLAGASEITPVLPQAPQLQVPNASVPDVVNNLSSQISRSLAKWSTSSFQQKADKEHEKSVLDGQMAFQQGVAMEDLDMPGDKHLMQGYRVMQAQTMASTMLAAQQQEISQGGYEKSPEEFRAIYVNRLDSQLEGLDSQTARMVREQMSNHMPTLVAQHTTAHMQNEEQNAFNSLATSVDTMSKDPTSAQALLSNALGGEGTASAGLSQDRTRAAVIQGTVDAFSNGNPLAYTQLKSAGILEDLPVAEKEQLELAKKQYEAKLRTTYDAEFTANMEQHARDVAAGKYPTPEAALDALLSIHAKRGTTVSQAEAGATYAGSSTAGDLGERADVIVLQTALTTGDHELVASLTQDIVMYHESGGDPDAVSPVGAQGLMQVMPATSLDPGYGVTPSDGTKAGNVRVGQEYWAAMIAGNKGKGTLNWEAGDIEAAAIAYNAGPQNAKKWIEAGRDYSVLPKRSETEPYAKKIMASANGADNYYTRAEELSLASSELDVAQQLKAAIARQQDVAAKAADKQATIVREDLFRQALQPLNAQLQAGTMTGAEYQVQSRGLLETYELDMTRSISLAVIADVDSANIKATTRATKLAAEAVAGLDAEARAQKLEDIAKYQIEVADLGNVFRATLAMPGKTTAQIEADQATYFKAVTKSASDNGLVLAETKFGALVTFAGKAMAKAKVAAFKYDTEQTVIDNAVSKGIVASMPQALQDRAYKQMGEENAKLVSDAVASGQISEDQAPLALAQANTASWIQARQVPRDVSRHSNAIMKREFVTDGVPNEQAIAVIQQWDAIREDNPEVANTMFDDASEIKAEALLDMAGGSFSSNEDIGHAMVAMQRQVDGKAALLTGNLVDDTTVAIGRAMEAADNFLASEDIGWIQDIFDSSIDGSQVFERLDVEEQAVFSDTAKELVGNEILNEAIRLESISPGQTSKFYNDKAAGNILKRTSVIGNSILVMEKGHSLTEQMFGDAAADMDKPGIEQEVILHAMRQLIEDNPGVDGKPGEYDYISETSMREQFGITGRTALLAADAVAGVFGGEVQRPVISQSDAESISSFFGRNVRPFHVETHDNKAVNFRVLLQNGELGPILPIELKSAGEAVRAKYLAELAE